MEVTKRGEGKGRGEEKGKEKRREERRKKPASITRKKKIAVSV